MSRHKWDRSALPEASKGTPCTRPGCGVRRRFRKATSRYASPQGAYTYREEYSEDGGKSWGDLKAYQGRVPECRGNYGVRLSRTTDAGTTYAASFSEEPSREVVEALDQVADAARDLLARVEGSAA